MATSVAGQSVPIISDKSQPPPAYDESQQHQVVYPATTQHVTTIVAQPGIPVINPTIITPLMYGPVPISTTCPHCQARIVTSTSYESGILTWLACGGIALVGCFCGCCLIPFCINDLQDCNHTCPNCKNFLGVYRRV